MNIYLKGLFPNRTDCSGEENVTLLFRISILGFIILCLHIQIHAVWSTLPSKNLPICRAAGTQEDTNLVTDGAGGAILAWTDHRAGNGDVYAQRVDAMGKPLWQLNGIAIRSTPEDQEFKQIITDDLGGAIIFWTHDKGPGGDDLYAQRLDPQGNELWNSGGILIEGNLEVWSVHAVMDGSSGAFICMQDAWGNGFFWIKRLTGNGLLPWAQAVSPMVTGKNNVGARITHDGVGGVVVAWLAHSGNPSTDADLYVQRLNSSGSAIWTSPVLICDVSAPVNHYAIAPDLAGGAFLFWSDARNPTTGLDIYVQRVNTSGSTLWSSNGLTVSAYNGSQDYPIAIEDVAGGAIVMWQDQRSNPSATESYLQKVDSIGNMAWTSHGLQLSLNGNYHLGATLAPDISGGCVVAFERVISLTESDIYAQRFDSTGTVTWVDHSGLAVCNATSIQSSPRVISDAVGGALISWKDYRESTTLGIDIYMQRVVKNGTLGPKSAPKPFPLGHASGITPVAGDPISFGTASFQESWPLFSLGGPKSLELALVYTPDLQQMAIATDGKGIFTPESNQSFTLNYMAQMTLIEDRSIVPNQLFINVLIGDQLLVFEEVAGEFQSVGPIKYPCNWVDNTFVFMDPVSEWVYFFPTREVNWDWGESFVLSCGELTERVDRSGNAISISYNEHYQPLTIQDTFGRQLSFEYHPSLNRLLTVTDQSSRSISFEYAEYYAIGGQPQTVLSGFRNLDNKLTEFSYFDITNTDANLIQTVFRSMGNWHFDQGWFAPPGHPARIDTQYDPFGNQIGFTFEEISATESQTTVAYPEYTTSYRCLHNRYPVERTAPGQSLSYSYSDDYELTGISREGEVLADFLVHEPTGFHSSATNAEDESLSFSYTSQEQTISNMSGTLSVPFIFYNLTRIDYQDDTFETAEYDTFGHMVTWLDRGNNSWTYNYTAEGLLQELINPADGHIVWTYNTDGTLASVSDSDSSAVSFAYDEQKRLSRITHPDTTYFEFTYDAMDRVKSLIDENEHTLSFVYDDNGNLISSTDPLFHNDQYTFDFMDRLESSTNRTGQVHTYGYDQYGRIASLENNGNSYSFLYAETGHLQQIIDPLFRAWDLGTNSDGLIETIQSPMGFDTHIVRDRVGRIIQASGPLTYHTNFEYDTAGRLVSETDASGLRTMFSYDSRGFINSMQRTGIQCGFTHNALGRLTEFQDYNKNNWTMTYSQMGRITEISDPLEQQWNYTYESQGLVSQINFHDGSTEGRSYDESGRLIQRHFSDLTEINFTRDELGRITETEGISLNYNASGQVTRSADGVMGFDTSYYPSGLIHSISYANSAFLVIYTYDERNLLQSVSDSLTDTQVLFSYDDDGRLTGITRSNGVPTEIQWDANGFVSLIQHGTLAQMSFTQDASGKISQMDATVPNSGVSFLENQQHVFTYDAASQLTSLPYQTDVRGRNTDGPWGVLSFDDASRVTALNATAFTYNGLGYLRTRVHATDSTRFFYQIAFDTPRVLAEMDDNSEVLQKYYVWSPWGELLYSIEAHNGNEIRFYYFDHIGNTLFLTDSSGVLTDSYAYEPYGLLLSHEGLSEQPYTYRGAWGVRQMNSVGSLYLMKNRLYDAQAGRFVTRDPVWLESLTSSQNPYTFAACQPHQFAAIEARFPHMIPSQAQISTRWINSLITFPEFGLGSVISATKPDFHGASYFANEKLTHCFGDAFIQNTPSWQAQTAEKGMFNQGMRTGGGATGNETYGWITGRFNSPIHTVDYQLFHLFKDANCSWLKPGSSPDSGSGSNPGSNYGNSSIIGEGWRPLPSLMQKRWPSTDPRVHKPSDPEDFRPLLHLGSSQSVRKGFLKSVGKKAAPTYPNTAEGSPLIRANYHKP